MGFFTGNKDFEAQPKRNRAATAINARTAGTVTVDPSIHPNGRLGLKKAAVATFCFATCLNAIGRSAIEVLLRRVVTRSKTDEGCSICALLFTSASYLSLLSSAVSNSSRLSILSQRLPLCRLKNCLQRKPDPATTHAQLSEKEME